LGPVPAGVEGEIFLGGTGVARGYLNRPELEAEKFIVTDNLTGLPVRLYRTGDLARASAGGELEYLGRADDQVKLRGYRVELTEIEACLVECPGVLAAAASVHPATQRIAAYVVRRSGVALDRARLRDALARRLAPYMVPAFLDEVDELPMTVSGKIDRRRLPPASTPLADGRGALVAPRTDAERTIVKAWEAVLGRDGISVNDDFFLDLDGHSMLAALAVSRLRRERGFEGLSIADLYAKPTVEKLAALFSGERKNGQSSAPKPSAFYSAPAWKYAACTAGQAMGILFVSGIYAWQWLGAFLAYGYLVVMDWSVREALVIALLVYLVTTPVVLLLSIALKWLLLGRVRPGEYPLWGWFYWRFWFVRAVVRAAPVNHLAGTPLIN
ncbi:MAG: AMP-binding protein, partial [Elusimicrobia bacterium]|nr:AMP-binding protein [Elusimicrobiota bacterium]